MTLQEQNNQLKLVYNSFIEVLLFTLLNLEAPSSPPEFSPGSMVP